MKIKKILEIKKKIIKNFKWCLQVHETRDLKTFHLEIL